MAMLNINKREARENKTRKQEKSLSMKIWYLVLVLDYLWLLSLSPLHTSSP